MKYYRCIERQGLFKIHVKTLNACQSTPSDGQKKSSIATHLYYTKTGLTNMETLQLDTTAMLPKVQLTLPIIANSANIVVCYLETEQSCVYGVTYTLFIDPKLQGKS